MLSQPWVQYPHTPKVHVSQEWKRGGGGEGEERKLIAIHPERASQYGHTSAPLSVNEMVTKPEDPPGCHDHDQPPHPRLPSAGPPLNRSHWVSWKPPHCQTGHGHHFCSCKVTHVQSTAKIVAQAVFFSFSCFVAEIGSARPAIGRRWMVNLIT
jgi:hypothetical protein